MTKRLRNLRYKLVPLGMVVSFTDDAGPVETVIAGFRCVATASGLTAEPVGELEADYEFEDEYEAEYIAKARSALHDGLQAWSATSELIDKSPLAFEYQGASVETIETGREQALMAHALIDTGSFTEAVAVAKNKADSASRSIRLNEFGE